MRSRSPLLGTLLLALASLGPACARRPSIAFEVAVSDAEPRTVDVAARVSGGASDSLVLNGFADAKVLRVSDLRAFDDRGRPLEAALSADTSTVEGRAFSIPRIVVRGSRGGPVVVRYRVAPGARGGDSHMGFTGECDGYVGPAYALVAGRSVFVLPDRGESVGPIRVRFRLPAGWTATTPWRQGGGWLRPDLDGRYGAEHLIAATLGLGAFREREFEVGRTRFRVAFAPGIPDSECGEAARALEGATRRVHDLFGSDLGPSYLVVAAPPAPDGDEIRGEAWGTGQGMTLAPVTADRTFRYARSLIDAYLRFAPYRTEVHAPEEYWLVDGIGNLYGWRAAAAAGVVDEAGIERDLAVSYLNARRVQGAEHDLTRIYATRAGAGLAAEVEAPFLLACLDRALRAESAGRESLDVVIRRVFRTDPARSLWESLPRDRGASWISYRDRYARGVEAIPAAALFGFEAAKPLPSPPAGREVRHLTIAFTGDTQGFLEHCGCKVNQSGGVARRATVIARLRREHPALPLLDLGNAFLRPGNASSLDYLSREEQRLYLQTMERMHYDALSIGTTELAFGPSWFRDAGRGLRLPYLSCNVLDDGAPIAPPSTMIRSGGTRIAVVSVFEPPQGPGTLETFEANSSGLTFEDPVRTAAREVARVRGDADLVMVIGRLTPATVHRLASECPDVDLILTNAAASSNLIQGPDGEEPGRDPQGFLGRTLVLYEDSRNYGLETVDLGMDAAGHIASARTTHFWLYEDVPDDPAYRAMLTRFYDRVGRQDSAQASVRPLFADSLDRLQGIYVGAARCLPCHRPEYEQWKTTRHATAYKTLLDAHRHYQPKCVVCHVVGFRTRTGYRLGDPEEPLANVQCEVCHGPGGDHVRRPAAVPMTADVSEAICVECHNPEHSERFVYAEKLPLVRHDAFGVGRAASR